MTGMPSTPPPRHARRTGRVPLASALVLAVSLAVTPLAAGASSAPSAVVAARSRPARVAATHRGTGAVAVDPAECARNRAAGPITFVSPFGYDASAGIVDVFAAQQLGYFARLCLDVETIGNSYDGIELVSAGKAQFTGEGSAADTLQAIAGGAHLVGIETSGDTSDYALVTRPAITDLRQLEGKTLGYHTVLPVVIREMLITAGVDVAKVDLVDDTSYNPMQIVQGTVDALQAYQSNEVVELRAAKAAFREWTPAQFHISGTYNVMATNPAYLSAHRAVVADFMRADLHALGYCLAHGAACVDMLGAAASKAGASFDRAHELAVWAVESALTRAHTLPGRGIGVQSEAEWRPEAQALRRDSVLRSVPSLARAEDTSLVASLYHGTTLIWP